MFWEFLIIPAALAVIAAILFIIVSKTWNKDWIGGIGFGVSILACIFLLAGFIMQGMTRGEAIEAEAYWATFIEPNIIASEGDTVIVANPQAAIWQAGEWNLPYYNTWLALTRYQDSLPVFGGLIYAPPEYLKFVTVNK